jgi:hypothetical protein
MNSFVWKIALALLGCVMGAFVGDKLMGGSAVGWVMAAVVVSAACYPMFKILIERNRSR